MTNSPAVAELQYIWPDLTIDQIAFKQAQAALGRTASLSDTLRKAQEIKEFLGEK